jgi:hypothetical protein
MAIWGSETLLKVCFWLWNLFHNKELLDLLTLKQ